MTHDVDALVKRLRKLKVWDDHPSNASLGEEVATALQAEHEARVKAEVERDEALRDVAELRCMLRLKLAETTLSPKPSQVGTQNAAHWARLYPDGNYPEGV